jgi:hypothetical protein
MLQHLGMLTVWEDREIGVSDDWFEEIRDKLERCTVAILLISANFLSSKFCLQQEVLPLLERRKRRHAHCSDSHPHMPLATRPVAEAHPDAAERWRLDRQPAPGSAGRRLHRDRWRHLRLP